MVAGATSAGVLRGHKAPVNCLSVCASAPDILASGSDDSTCRVWDLRSRRVSQCIAHAFAGDPVNSVVFASSVELYVASRNQVYMFDLRHSSSLILTDATTIFEPAADDINRLHVHPMSNKKPWLVVPDDEGDIGLLNMQTHAIHTLRGQHSSICSAAAFRPRCGGYDLVSGGLDSQLLFWEVRSDGSGGRVRSKIDMQHLETLGDATQIWNPPFVFDVAFSATGKTVAAALGDGSIALVDFASKSIAQHLRGGHHAPVGVVQFFDFRSTEYVISAGNDSKVCIWPSSDTTEPCVTIPLRHKPNDVAVSGDAIYVADVSPFVSIYELH
ncbi:hypothetical protein DYB34_013041 [Aphanomyces astaci]|uniref:Uncharacterized protein n=1 Tax=Aphanomyces astaci TaxID=112090 RepID=A0A397AUD4_APHAT|nr:hypothetical protein DYB36_010611 [Aphanomyces astaci]RHY44605.1 hypothetical protein DYB34_013041 [Aphanomyces astaci]